MIVTAARFIPLGARGISVVINGQRSTRTLVAIACMMTVMLAGAEPEPLVKVDNFHLKTERYGAAAVAAGDYIYVIAGGNRNGLLKDIERFDTRTHEIQIVANQLKPRRYHGAVFLNGKILIVGGQAADVFNSKVTDVDINVDWTLINKGSALKTVTTDRSHEGAEDSLSASLEETAFETKLEIFDVATAEIRYGSPLPTPRISAAVVNAAGRVYVIGGLRRVGRSAAQTNLNEVYDPESDHWTTGVPMPTPREVNAVIVGDFVLVPGGTLHRAAMSKVEFFIPQQNTWMTLPDLCKPMGAGSVVHLGSYLFLFGSFGADDRVVAYDLRDRTSRTITPGFKPARHTAAIAHDGLIYVIGGSVNPEGDALTDIQVFALAEAK